jgi:hypothetical protein
MAILKCAAIYFFQAKRQKEESAIGGTIAKRNDDDIEMDCPTAKDVGNNAMK